VNPIVATFEKARLEKRLALLAYLTAGYPSPELTPRLVQAVTGAGADMVELGIPFSDPLADGRTIQSAAQAALEQHMSVARSLEVARGCRALTPAPILFMSYMNPLLAYGLQRFCADAAQAGANGLLVPDLPPEEADELRTCAQAASLGLAFFIAPTSSPERIRAACEASTAFVYCIALTGITGARDQLDEALLPLLERIRPHARVPIVVGFGLSRPEHLEALRGRADGAIVASALLDAIARSPTDPVAAAERFIRSVQPLSSG
jgi:tryptophan synthase alpha chain